MKNAFSTFSEVFFSFVQINSQKQQNNNKKRRFFRSIATELTELPSNELNFMIGKLVCSSLDLSIEMTYTAIRKTIAKE